MKRTIHKLLLLTVPVCSIMHTMNTPLIKTLVWNSNSYNTEQGYTPRDLVILDMLKHHSFKNSRVLDFDGDKATATQIAQSAQGVYQNHPEARYIQYDCIVISNFNHSRKEEFKQHLCTCSPLIRGKGLILMITCTKKDNSLLQKTMDELYFDIYEAARAENKEDRMAPSRNSNDWYFSSDEFKKVSNRFFTVQSQEQKTYNIIIKDQELYENLLAQQFCDSITFLNLSHEKIEDLQRKFITRIIEQLSRDENGNLIESISFTKILWRKYLLRKPS